MSRPFMWFRLYRGRVWHVRPGTEAFAELALCGAAPVDTGEEQATRPPRGAKPCPECMAVAGSIEEAGLEALAIWCARHYSPSDDNDLVDAEIVDGDEPDDLEDDLEQPEVIAAAGPEYAPLDLVGTLQDAISRAQAFKAAVAEIPGVEVE